MTNGVMAPLARRDGAAQEAVGGEVSPGCVCCVWVGGWVGGMREAVRVAQQT